MGQGSLVDLQVDSRVDSQVEELPNKGVHGGDRTGAESTPGV